MRRDAWWLKMIAVLPGERRKGIGKALVSKISCRVSTSLLNDFPCLAVDSA